MYLNWYRNFWAAARRCDGRPIPKLPSRRTRRSGSCAGASTRGLPGLRDAYSPWNLLHVLENLRSGVAPPADMFVFGYASVDLLAERLHSTVELHELSVSAFLHARPYMTDRAAAAYNRLHHAVWALPSYLTSAADYQEYLEYCLADPTPAFWLPRGPAAEIVISPLVDALRETRRRDRAGGKGRGRLLRPWACARSSLVERGGVDPVSGSWTGSGESWREPVGELVMAVPPMELSRLVRSGDAGRRIVERVPKLAELSRLRATPIPIVHLYLRRTLPGRAGRTGRLVRGRRSRSRSPTSRRRGPASWGIGPCLRSPLRTPTGCRGRGLRTTRWRSSARPRSTWLSIPVRPGASPGRSTGITPVTTRTPTRSCSSTRSGPTRGGRRPGARGSQTCASRATSAGARSG